MHLAVENYSFYLLRASVPPTSSSSTCSLRFIVGSLLFDKTAATTTRKERKNSMRSSILSTWMFAQGIFLNIPGYGFAEKEQRTWNPKNNHNDRNHLPGIIDRSWIALHVLLHNYCCILQALHVVFALARLQTSLYCCSSVQLCGLLHSQ